MTYDIELIFMCLFSICISSSVKCLCRSLALFFFLAFSRATPVAYGGSQARGLIGAVAAGLPEPQQHGI